MAGHHAHHGGGGSNYLCLSEEPQWRRRSNYRDVSTGWIYGVTYALAGDHASFFSTVHTGGRQLNDNPVPCAVCYVSRRSTSVTMPASTNCPVGWTQEYGGYVMSEHSAGGDFQPRHATTYICVDQAPEIATEASNHPGHTWLLIVRAGCGALPCSKYPEGWELACVVCSK